jgi:hypothetical protein
MLEGTINNLTNNEIIENKSATTKSTFRQYNFLNISITMKIFGRFN